MKNDSEDALRSAYQERKNGNSQAALALVERAIKRAHADDDTMRSKLLCAMGQFKRDLGAIESARDAYEQAAELFAKLNDKPALAYAWRHQGDLERELGRLNEAEKLLTDALAIYATQNDNHDLARANTERVLALIHESRGEQSQANKYWTSSRDVYEALNIADGVNECDAHLAK